MLKRMRSFLVAAMLMVIATVSAQVTTSSMSGKVTAQDEPIIGATVVAIHEPSGTRYGTVTNISGQFNLQGHHWHPKSEYYDSSRQDRYQPMDVYPSAQTERFVFCFPAYKNR